MLNIKRLCFILCCIFLFTANIAAQNGAQISADELTYNFGTIAEADGWPVILLSLKIRETAHWSSPVSLHPAVVRNRNGQKHLLPRKDRKRESNLQSQRTSGSVLQDCFYIQQR